jgi:GxxExxY protein
MAPGFGLGAIVFFGHGFTRMDTDPAETNALCSALFCVEEATKLVLPGLTEPVIGAAMEVANVLGAGFLEKVYERALTIELRSLGLSVIVQPAFEVQYKGQSVGEFLPDLFVNGELLVELKCVDRLAPEHVGQCINYLRASGLRIALPLNFQRTRLEWKRVTV